MDTHTSTATLAPLLIICCFELSYVVHKTRGANFCCITFDVRACRAKVTNSVGVCVAHSVLRLLFWLQEGHRDNSACISLARFFPWIYAFALGVVTLMVCMPSSPPLPLPPPYTTLSDPVACWLWFRWCRQVPT